MRNRMQSTNPERPSHSPSRDYSEFYNQESSISRQNKGTMYHRIVERVWYWNYGQCVDPEYEAEIFTSPKSD